MTIYEIDEQISKLLEKIDPETGELLIDEEALEALQMERDRKVENIALAIKNISAESEALGNEIKNLSARKKTADNKVKSLKDFLARVLQGDKFKTARVAISYRKSDECVIDDRFVEWAKAMAPELLKTEPKKADIKAALKNGTELEYAHIEERSNIQIK